MTRNRDASVIMDRSDSNVVASAMALVLVFALSLRLRQREIRTVCGIGGSRSTVARLLAAEITIILFMSGVLCAAAIGIVDWYSSDLVRRLFIG